MVTVKQRNQPSNRGDQPVTFRHSDAQRIANAVAAHEGGRRDRKSSQLPRAAGGAGGGIVTATFLANWLTNQDKVVHLGGAVTNTASARNELFDIVGSGGQNVRKCLLSRHPVLEGAYILVNFDCR